MLQHSGGRQRPEALGSRRVLRRPHEEVVLPVRLEPDRRSRPRIDALVHERQRQPGLEGIDPVVRSRVRVLLSLGVPVISRRRLGRLQLCARGPHLRPAGPQRHEEECAHHECTEAEATITQEVREFLSCDSTDHDLSPPHVLEVDLLEIGVADVVRVHLRSEPSMAHDPNARARLLGAKEVVRCHEDGHATLTESLKKCGELVGRLRIETGGRFIEEKRARLLRDRDRDAHLLPHAFRIATDLSVDRIRLESGLRQHRPQSLSPQLLPRKRREVLEVFEPRQVAIQHDLLGDVREMRLRLEIVSCDVHPRDKSLAVRRWNEPDEEVDRRGLACTVGPEQAVDLTGLDTQVELGNGSMAPVALGQRSSFEHGLRADGIRWGLGFSNSLGHGVHLANRRQGRRVNDQRASAGRTGNWEPEREGPETGPVVAS